MNEVALAIDSQSLPAMLDRAAMALASSKSSAEVLDAREMANLVYDVAKKSARLARAKEACDDVVASCHRAQADALEIISRAQLRLADEYDAAQERGEIRAANERTASSPEAVGVSDIGLSHKQIHEARQVRDAEGIDPGIVRRTLDERIADGKEPTKTSVREAIEETLGRAPVRGTAGTGDNEWYTPAEYIELARQVLGGIDLDPASNPTAQETVCAERFFTKDDDGLTQPWSGRVWLNPPYAQPAIAQFIDKVVEEVGAGRVSEAIVLTHNYTDTAWFQKLAASASAICFTRGRVRFYAPNGDKAAPTQGQAFTYFGPNSMAFAETFSACGFVVEVV